MPPANVVFFPHNAVLRPNVFCPSDEYFWYINKVWHSIWPSTAAYSRGQNCIYAVKIFAQQKCAKKLNAGGGRPPDGGASTLFYAHKPRFMLQQARFCPPERSPPIAKRHVWRCETTHIAVRNVPFCKAKRHVSHHKKVQNIAHFSFFTPISLSHSLLKLHTQESRICAPMAVSPQKRQPRSCFRKLICNTPRRCK